MLGNLHKRIMVQKTIYDNLLSEDSTTILTLNQIRFAGKCHPHIATFIDDFPSKKKPSAEVLSQPR